MLSNIKIAIVQFAIAHLQPEINLVRAEEFVKQASEQDARVIVFPEDFLTGSIFGDVRYLDRNHENLKKFQILAKKYAIDIVAGSWMEQTPSGAFSTSSYIDSTGKVLGEYHKNHLYATEQKFLTPGTQISVFDTSYGRVGIIICWDIIFPEIFASMQALGVQIVYCPSYWYKEIAGKELERNFEIEEQKIDALCLSRAKEFNIVLIYVNAAGITRYEDGSSDHLIGHSQVTVPTLGVIKKLSHNREEMVCYNVNL